MKKLILITILVSLLAAPAFAAATLGWWDSDHPRAIHAEWDFTDGEPGPGGQYKYNESPVVNTGEGGSAFIGDPATTSYASDALVPFIKDPTAIEVFIELDNFPELYAFKEIWVDVEFTGILTGIDAFGDTEGVEHTTYLLDYPNPGSAGTADFGFKITPNPWKENIWFTIVRGDALDAPLPSLRSITIDTICIPAPGAILLGSIGVSFVGWLKRRRTL